MADSKASALTLASALGGTELWAAVQGGADRKITAQLLADYVIGLISDGAPAALDTLNELAAALADDASFAASVTAALAGKQPLDSDLTAIAALTTTSFGRGLLTLADAAAMRLAINAPMVIGQSGVAVSHTGDTSETTLATIPVAAGLLGANGQLVIEALWSVTNNANTKTPRVRLGGTAVHGPALGAVASFHDRIRVANRNSASSQVINPNSATVYGASSGTVFTSSVATGSAFDITLTAQLGNSADTMTLESYLITAFPLA